MANYCNGNWPAVTQIPTSDQAIAAYCGSGGAWRVEGIFIIVCYVFTNTHTHTQVSVHKVSIGRVFAFTVYKQTYTHTNVNNCVCVCVCTLYVCPVICVPQRLCELLITAGRCWGQGVAALYSGENQFKHMTTFILL